MPKSFTTRRNAHKQVLVSPKWYGDPAPPLGPQFTAEKTRERKYLFVQLLRKAKRRRSRLGEYEASRHLGRLARKISRCSSKDRCGSLACPECCRAFQQAKAAALRDYFGKMQKERLHKQLVMANVIPLSLRYTPEQLVNLDVRKHNRTLKDKLRRAGFDRVMVGAFELSWEADFYQPHWHIGMFTANRDRLRERMKMLFAKLEPGDRPVVISKCWSMGFVEYQSKTVKPLALLKRNRRHLPELLLALDRTDALETLVLCRTRLSAQHGRLIFKQMKRR